LQNRKLSLPDPGGFAFGGKMEIFDLYDEQGNLTNKLMSRGGTNLVGEYHLVTHIWIRNTQGEYLIQQRNKLDDPIPFQWAATGGAVLAGETSIQATIRETWEELGLKLDEIDFRRLKSYFIEDAKANYITDLYLVEKDIQLDTLRLDKTEVKAVTYKTMAQIKDMIRDELFWDYEKNMGRTDYLTILERA